MGGRHLSPLAGGRLPSHRWALLRRFILDRDGWRCRRCGRPGRLEVHHVNGNPSDNREANLLTYCRTCHIEVHKPTVAPDVADWRRLVANT